MRPGGLSSLTFAKIKPFLRDFVSFVLRLRLLKHVRMTDGVD